MPVAPRRRWPAVALAVLAVAYLAQLATPLRLNTDAVTLLTMARSAAAGDGFTVDGRPAQFPVGYPAVLLALDRAGVAGSPAFVGLNLLCLALFLWQSARLVRREWDAAPADAWAAVGLTLLSFPVVKHVTIPLTEMPYAALSVSALNAMSVGRRSPTAGRAAAWIAAAAGLAAAAIAVRTVGIALVPALAWAAATAGPVRRRVVLLSRPTVVGAQVGLAIAVPLALAATAVTLSRTTYVRTVRSNQTPAQQVRRSIANRASDFGELAVNLPAARLPRPAQPAVPVVGVAALALVGLGLWARRSTFGPTDVYLLGYAAILAVWPYSDPRFYVPVAPFAAALMAVAIHRLPLGRAGPWVRRGCLGWFALTGLAALAASTRLSWAGDRFADAYGTPDTQATYGVAFGRRPSADLPPGAEPWIALLRRYEPRARR